MDGRTRTTWRARLHSRRPAVGTAPTDRSGFVAADLCAQGARFDQVRTPLDIALGFHRRLGIDLGEDAKALGPWPRLDFSQRIVERDICQREVKITGRRGWRRSGCRKVCHFCSRVNSETGTYHRLCCLQPDGNMTSRLRFGHLRETPCDWSKLWRVRGESDVHMPPFGETLICDGRRAVAASSDENR